MSYNCTNITKEEAIARKFLSILGRENPHLESVRRTIMKIVFGVCAESVVDGTITGILRMRQVSDAKREKAVEFIRGKLSQPLQFKENLTLSGSNSRICNHCNVRKNNNDFLTETISVNGVNRQVLTTCYDCVDLGALQSLTTLKVPKKHGGVPHNKRHDVYMDKGIIVALYKGGMFTTEIAVKYKCSAPLISKIIKEANND
jgi:hypothetical protein